MHVNHQQSPTYTSFTSSKRNIKNVQSGLEKQQPKVKAAWEAMVMEEL
jgi:hypothetical protein